MKGEREEDLNGGLQNVHSGYPWVVEIWVLFFFFLLNSYDPKKDYLGKDMVPEMGSFRVFPSMQYLWRREWEFRSAWGYERDVFLKSPTSGMGADWNKVIR